jgi:tetratricopeptide (TPR) repeat protein
LTERAEQAYLEFQALQPNSAYGFRDLGILYRAQGRLVEAQAQLEQAGTVSPRDVASRYELALVYLDQDMLSEVEREMDTILAQSRSTLFNSRLFDPELYQMQARLYQARGDSEQAIDALGKVALIRGEPGDYLALADLYHQLDQPQQAVKQCTEAADALLRTWPRPLDSRLWAIGLCLAQSPGVDTDTEIARIARDHPLTGNVLLGHLHRARGELEQALTAYQAAAAARPDEGAPHYFLGETYQALGQPERAETEYRQGATLDPLESLPLLALGQMQWGMGQQEAALEAFNAAVETTPGWGQAHVALGNALLALGDREGAAEHYQLAQLADRDFQEGLVYDLAAQLGTAQIEAPDIGYVKNDYFAIGGKERRVLFMHPDSLARYTLQVPEGGSLAFELATSPESWEQPGDGVAFAVYVESQQGMEQVFSSYIDPKHEESDRRWHPHTVDLGAYAGQTVTIVLETTGGPAGDSRFDWAGWGTPRLLVP